MIEMIFIKRYAECSKTVQATACCCGTMDLNLTQGYNTNSNPADSHPGTQTMLHVDRSTCMLPSAEGMATFESDGFTSHPHASWTPEV